MVTANAEINDWLPFKETGNDFFKAGKFPEAIENYSKALEVCTGKDDKCVLYRNRAACFLKLEKFEEAIGDANKVLEQQGSDVKALFRRFVL